MGLDITAYTRIKKVGTAKDNEEFKEKFDWGKYKYVDDWWVNHFPGRADGIEKNAIYTYENSFSFSAGSYTGYNKWRNWLSKISLGVPASTVWSNEKTYKEKRFFELIYFSDCEGIIGPIVSNKLAKDFQEFQTTIDDIDDEFDYYKRKYADWRKAFETAADGGYVNFS